MNGTRPLDPLTVKCTPVPTTIVAAPKNYAKSVTVKRLRLVETKMNNFTAPNEIAVVKDCDNLRLISISEYKINQKTTL